MKKPIVLVVAAGIAIAAGALLKPKDPACVKIEAQVALADRFCHGMSERLAEGRCASLSDDPEVMGQCLRVIVPAAHSACMDYIEIEPLKRQAADLCS
jgi:hypothetical protein